LTVLAYAFTLVDRNSNELDQDPAKNPCKICTPSPLGNRELKGKIKINAKGAKKRREKGHVDSKYWLEGANIFVGVVGGGVKF
jgi:hypothetical protein